MKPESNLSWYAVYTRPRWEKKVAALLAGKRIEHYCPLNKVMRQWSDRKKLVEEPLFSGYVFVRTTDADKWRIKEIDGILNYVYWLGKPAIIADQEIQTIKRFLNEHQSVQIQPLKLQPNDRVKIGSGPFMDKEARVIAQNDKKAILEIPALQMRLTVHLAKTELERIAQH